ncbi:hypothetical protein B0H11DRAFT_1911900 [Mycena galericulata]|nr:hypothetical protein B0H11DRAFT_1911900 [Mycena galericulata]
MDSVDRVGDVNNELVRITDQGFQGIFSQYGSENNISPAMRNSLDTVTSSVIAALSTAASPKLVSRELKLIEEAIGSKTERGRARHALEAPSDVGKIVMAFKRFGDVIDRFQAYLCECMEKISEETVLREIGLEAAIAFNFLFAGIDAMNRRSAPDKDYPCLLEGVQWRYNILHAPL